MAKEIKPLNGDEYEISHRSSSIKRPYSLRPHSLRSPKMIIGDWLLQDGTQPGTIWLLNTKTGEGGDFDPNELATFIADFFDQYF